MRMYSVARQLSAVVMGGLLLGGCGLSDFISNPVGVGSPAPSKVAGYLQETSEQSVVDDAGNAMTAGEYLIASMSYTNEKCHQFFDTLERFKQDSTLIDKVLSAAAAAGSPLMAATGATGTAVARYAGILNFGNIINNNYREIYTFADFKEPLQTHVFDAMADFRIKNGLSTLTRSLVGVSLFKDKESSLYNPINYGTLKGSHDQSCESVKVQLPKPKGSDADLPPIAMNACKMNSFLASHDPIHLMVSRNIASEYASICSIASMRTIIYQALHATKSKVGNGDSPAPKTEGTTPPKGGT